MDLRVSRLVVSVLAGCLVGSGLGVGGDERAANRSASVDILLEGGALCVADGFDTPGQGFYLSGSTGGMVIPPPEYVDKAGVHATTTLTPIPVANMHDLLATPGEASVLDQTLNGDALIFVVDDFNGDKFTLPRALFDAQVPPTISDLEGLVDSGALSHGALVMHHLNTLIATTGHFGLIEDSDDRKVWDSGTGQLTVVGVDLPKTFETEQTVLSRADDVLAVLLEEVPSQVTTTAQGSPVRALVVNMSWVLLPCATIEDFLKNADQFTTFDEYLAWLELDPRLSDPVDMQEALTQLHHPGLEALFDTGVIGHPDVPVSFVAAAGNFSLPYQMLPADWDQIVGVAVEEVPTRTFPGRYSNVGDVTVPGEWFYLQELNESRHAPVAYAGTSFAAPAVALYAAMDAVGDMKCFPTHPGSRPLAPTTSLDTRLVDVIADCMP